MPITGVIVGSCVESKTQDLKGEDGVLNALPNLFHWKYYRKKLYLKQWKYLLKKKFHIVLKIYKAQVLKNPEMNKVFKSNLKTGQCFKSICASGLSCQKYVLNLIRYCLGTSP